MSVRIVTDSTVDLLPEVKARVTTVPMSVRFGDQEYMDGVTITPEMFYAMLVKSEDLPTTSQPTPAALEEVFRQIVEAGDEVVCITIASRLSGTYQSATIAAEEFKGKVFVVDSRTAAISSGILTEYALQLVDRGMCAEEIMHELIQIRKRVRLYAVVDTLEYLKKGGRLNSAVAVVGSVLNIKPIVCVEDGEIKVIGKARGMSKAFSMLNSATTKDGGIDRSKPILLGYTGESRDNLQKYMEDNRDLWSTDTRSTIVSATVGVHAGPGAVAAAFFSVE